MPEIHRDAKSAWLWLVEKGGLEPTGRDMPLLVMLQDRLDPETENLDEALANVTVTGFVNAFFGVITPFVGMMRDLLSISSRLQQLKDLLIGCLRLAMRDKNWKSIWTLSVNGFRALSTPSQFLAPCQFLPTQNCGSCEKTSTQPEHLTQTGHLQKTPSFRTAGKRPPAC